LQVKCRGLPLSPTVYIELVRDPKSMTLVNNKLNYTENNV